jgi:transcriptional regulator GlxA family with amidase domain
VAGPLQALDEANAAGADYRVELAGTAGRVRTAQSLLLAGLAGLPAVGEGDLVIVPGFRLREAPVPASLPRWLAAGAAAGAEVGSVCTGAFVLGEAGLLDGRQCTTHWKRVRELQQRFRRAKVLADRLFVRDGRVVTSAGIASGIDMALALVEEHHGPRLASRVAREMVVYLRRDGAHRQDSVFLSYRTHVSSGVHEVQDYLVAHPEERTTLAALARVGRMSPRTLTRRFRQATGVSVNAFRTAVRLEHARTLRNDPDLTLEAIAERVGYADGRQLRRLWKRR